MMILEQTYLQLKGCDLTDSQYDFSANWCGMGRSYLSWVKASKATPSIEALSKLWFRIEQESGRLQENGCPLYPEVTAHDASILNAISRSLKSELEKICVPPRSLVDAS